MNYANPAMLRANLPQLAAVSQMPMMAAPSIAQMGYSPSPYFAMVLTVMTSSNEALTSSDPMYSKYYVHGERDGHNLQSN